jgi:putative ABC transport system permease protein
VWGDAAVLAPAFDRSGYFQSLTFRMKDPSRFGAVKQELEADPRLQVQVKREDQFYSAQSELLTNIIRFMGIFITGIMAIGAIFGAMNTMYAAVQQRTREIATLLVLGFSPVSVMLSFMFESIFLALLGGVIGCLLALPVNGIGTSTTNFQSFSEVAFAFRVTPEALIAGLVFATAMGVLGGFLPALKAARQTLAISLRAA